MSRRKVHGTMKKDAAIYIFLAMKMIKKLFIHKQVEVEKTRWSLSVYFSEFSENFEIENYRK
jgi:hypothetical protein